MVISYGYGYINILVWEGAGSSPASEGEVDGGAGGEVAWAVQGAVPGCGEKGGKVTPTPTPVRCPGCCRLLLQGNGAGGGGGWVRGGKSLPNHWKMPPQPGTSPLLPTRCCGSRQVTPRTWGEFWDVPYLSARRAGREAARGWERGCPPLSSSYCCFGN